MVKQEKISTVKEIVAKISDSDLVIFSQYSKLTVAADRDLRLKLHKANAEYHVFKNTLTKRAFKDLGITVDEKHFNGPTSFIFSKEAVAPAKVLADFVKGNQALVIKGGVFQKKEVSLNDIKELANMPSRQELLSKLVYLLQSPITGFVRVVQGPLRKSVLVLNAIAEQKSKQA